jgi:simple sugar transport system ATP-binding protein
MSAGEATSGLPLEVRGVSKRYGPVRALEDVSFQLGHGQVVGLIGDNGAGKSTLVSLISGKAMPDSGEILVDGTPKPFHSPTAAREAGIETVFQTLSLIPTLDITENVYLNREAISRRPPWRWMRRMDKRAMRREVAEGFERLGLRLPALRTKAAALSGGQRQAVAIARAVLWGSHVVVLDEPTAALGVQQTEIVLSFVERLKSHGVSVVLITHNMEHVVRLCDRVVVLRLGRKIADRPIAEVDKLTLVAMMTGAYSEDEAAVKSG